MHYIFDVSFLYHLGTIIMGIVLHRKDHTHWYFDNEKKPTGLLGVLSWLYTLRSLFLGLYMECYIAINSKILGVAASFKTICCAVVVGWAVSSECVAKWPESTF